MGEREQAEALARALPDHARAVLRALEAAGHEAWVVGGWVRDALLGAPPHDVDVCSSAPWPEAERALRAAGLAVHETGVRHGTVSAVVGGRVVEVTTYRVDGAYGDGRHPDEVRFVRDVRLDLARRDFTVNAMAFHPRRGLLDPFGGRADARAGLLRAVGEPRERFEEDALRVLRAVRFAARLGFDVEPRTQRALAEAAPGLARIARERVGAELEGILGSGRAGWALRAEPAVMGAALPCLDAAGRRRSARVLDAVEALSGGVALGALRWAALLCGAGEREAGAPMRRDAPARAADGDVVARAARGALGEMAVPRATTDACCALLSLRGAPLGPGAGLRRTLRSLARLCPGAGYPLAHELVVLRRAMVVADGRAGAAEAVGAAWEGGVPRDSLASLAASEAALRAERSRGCALRVGELAVGGADVMAALGVGPGRAVGEALEWLLDQMVEEGLPNTRPALLAALSARRGGK